MAQKVGASQFTKVGAPPALAAQLADPAVCAHFSAMLNDPANVGRIFGGGGLIAIIRKLGPVIAKDGPLFMKLIGPLMAALSSGDWAAVFALATTTGTGGAIWGMIQDFFAIFPQPDVPAPPAA